MGKLELFVLSYFELELNIKVGVRVGFWVICFIMILLRVGFGFLFVNLDESYW